MNAMVWSAVTWMTGQVHTFDQLLFTRALMGISEAFYIPAALALIARAADGSVRDLTEEEVARLRTFIDQNVKVEGDLRRQIAQDIKRKMEIGCYEGLRHRKGLPVHGQRTRTNARTRKGPKKTVAGKKRARR